MQSSFVHAMKMTSVTWRSLSLSGMDMMHCFHALTHICPKLFMVECFLDDQVYVFEESNDGDHNIYVHHDIILSAFPLCTAWLDCPIKGGEKG